LEKRSTLARTDAIVLDLVGRDREQTIFKEALERQPSVVLVTGPLGVGKTRLLEHFNEAAQERLGEENIAWCDFNQKNIVAVARRMSPRVRGRRSKSKSRMALDQYDVCQSSFSENEWLEAISSILKPLNLNLGLVTIVGDKLEEAVLSPAREHLSSGRRSKNIDLFRDFNSRIADAFVEDLSSTPDTRRVFLFDDFERTQPFLEEWLFGLVRRCSHFPVTWVIASWVLDKHPPLSRDINVFDLSLSGFKLEEVYQYLRNLSEISGLCMAKEEQDAVIGAIEYVKSEGYWSDLDGYLPWVVDAAARNRRIWKALNSELRQWMDNASYSEILTICAVSSRLNEGVMDCLSKANLFGAGSKDVFRKWWQSKGSRALFTAEDRLELLKPVRYALIRYLQDEEPVKYERAHGALYEYCFDEQLHCSWPDLASVFRFSQNDRQWRAFLQGCYHLLSRDPEKGLVLCIETALLCMNSPEDRTRVYEVTEVILGVVKENPDLKDVKPFSSLSTRRPSDGEGWPKRPLLVWGEFLRDCAKSFGTPHNEVGIDVLDGEPDWREVIDYFGEFCDLPELRPAARIEALYGRGMALQENGEYDKAYNDFERLARIAVENSMLQPLEEARESIARVVDLLYRKGTQLQEDKEYNKAYEDFAMMAKIAEEQGMEEQREKALESMKSLEGLLDTESVQTPSQEKAPTDLNVS
jgi:tetratricopeptide (TPR) repeat protein